MKTLKDYFCEKGITQKQMAEMLGIQRSYLNSQINGKRPFRWDQVVFMCEVLGIENPLREVFPSKHYQ